MRSKWKGPLFSAALFNMIKRNQNLSKNEVAITTPLRLFNRATWVVDELIDCKNFFELEITVYAGKRNKPLKINNANMRYHRVGEFSSTRKRHVFISKKKQ